MKDKKIGSVIAHDMIIAGDVTFQGQLVIDGKIEGSLKGDLVELGRTGVLDGEISLKNLDCYGKTRGSVFAGRVTVRDKAEITGILESDELEMAPGAVFSGEMKIASDRPRQEKKGVGEKPSIVIPASFERKDTPVQSEIAYSEVEQNQADDAVQESFVLDGLTAALVGGSSLIMVISEDKEARKSLCSELQARLNGSYQLLFIEEPTGSFREMLIRVAAGFDVELKDYSNQDSIIQNLVSSMTDVGRFLLLVDNVETMYPATLERIVRYLAGEEGQETVLTKLVLFGGMELKRMMDFEDSKFFVREPDCIFEL